MALLRERDRGRPPDAARRAGDERDAGRSGGVAHGAPQRSSALAQAIPAPKPESEHELTGLQAPGVRGLGERERDRRGRRVAVLVDVDDRLLHRDAEPLARGLDDADVRLVGDEPVDLVGA